MTKRKLETLLILVGIIAAAAVIWNETYGLMRPDKKTETPYITSKYGAFLAAQHAIYVNDFDTAAEFSKTFADIKYPIVQNTVDLTHFLSGILPADAKSLQNEKQPAQRLIYDAYLITQNAWSDLYKRHKKDDGALTSPLRIWASVATGKQADALKFIKQLPTNKSWQAFVRGQIYAESGDIDAAADAFASVEVDFLNINDYMYLMSFYLHNNMLEDADILRSDFTARPGGMFLLDFEEIPDWSTYTGTKNALAFSLIQNVSHTQIMMYSDMSILLLRLAQIAGDGNQIIQSAINYYIGQFFFNNNGDFKTHFDKIPANNPYYMFAVMRTAEGEKDYHALQRAFNKNPLFVPAANMLTAHYVQNGERRRALRVVNRALADKNLTEEGRAFFLKSRANIHYMFGNLSSAQSDLYDAASVLSTDNDIMSLQAKIWAAQNRELDNAYEYAMTLVTQNPTDVFAWDTLGTVVAQREGELAALDILTRVADVANSCSSLFVHLGDLHAKGGNVKAARDAYLRAIDLSDDGQTIVPEVKKKLRKLK